MLSSSKSATLITCSSSFTSESSLTLSTENLRASPDLIKASSAATLSKGNDGQGECNSLANSIPKGVSFVSRNSCRTPTSGSLLLSVPNERYGLRRISIQSGQRFPPVETLFEDSSELIINCGALSSAVLGRIKSFSTSDITITSGEIDDLHDLPFSSGSSHHPSDGHRMKSSSSEVIVFGGHDWDPRLALPNNIRSFDANSRSCSTWAIVGDRSISSVSQLPSPSQAHSVSGTLSPILHPMDIVFSMNKKVRQMYIRQRLLSTYRTLERLSRSHLDLGNIIKGDLVNKLAIIQGTTTKITRKPGESGITGGDGGSAEGPSLVNSFNKLNNKSMDVSSPSSSSVITHNESIDTKEPFSNQSYSLSNPITRSTTTTFEAQYNNDMITTTNCLTNQNNYDETDEPNNLLDCNSNSINYDTTPDINNNSNNITNEKNENLQSSAGKLHDRLASTSFDLIQLQNDLLSLSVRDVELQKGKSLTKYERNMMIFDWLQNLDQEEPN